MCKTDALPTELRTLGGETGNRTPINAVQGRGNPVILFPQIGRDCRIRTYDFLLPKQATYQTSLNPVNKVLPLGDKGGAEPQVIMPLGQLHRKTHRLHL